MLIQLDLCMSSMTFRFILFWSYFSLGYSWAYRHNYFFLKTIYHWRYDFWIHLLVDVRNSLIKYQQKIFFSERKLSCEICVRWHPPIGTYMYTAENSLGRYWHGLIHMVECLATILTNKARRGRRGYVDVLNKQTNVYNVSNFRSMNHKFEFREQCWCN